MRRRSAMAGADRHRRHRRAGRPDAADAARGHDLHRRSPDRRDGRPRGGHRRRRDRAAVPRPAHRRAPGRRAQAAAVGRCRRSAWCSSSIAAPRRARLVAVRHRRRRGRGGGVHRRGAPRRRRRRPRRHARAARRHRRSRAELEAIPWVEDAQVHTDFPHGATIEIRERTPAGHVRGRRRPLAGHRRRRPGARRARQPTASTTCSCSAPTRRRATPGSSPRRASAPRRAWCRR